MKTISIIPARMNSSRFPGKPMEKICGIPMIGHCYNRSTMCSKLDETFVATCDKEIHNYIKSIGGNSIMTSKNHTRASDRTAEALNKIEKKYNTKIDIVVMIQGDEPLIHPSMIVSALQPFNNKKVNVVNLMSKIVNVKSFNDINEVKVIVDKNNDALYFSRYAIPYNMTSLKNVGLKQVCIIPFRRDFLKKFNALKEVDIEIKESIDMLRLLFNGHKVKMVYSKYNTQSVDNKKDLIFVQNIMKKDKIRNKYKFI